MSTFTTWEQMVEAVERRTRVREIDINVEGIRFYNGEEDVEFYKKDPLPFKNKEEVDRYFREIARERMMFFL